MKLQSIFWSIYMEEIKKSCENCSHFMHYYILSSDGYFKYIYAGFCGNSNIRYLTRKHKKNLTPCGYWQPIKIRQTEIKERLIYKIKNAARDMNDILQIIKSGFFD